MQREYILSRIVALIGSPDTTTAQAFLNELALEDQEEELTRAGVHYLIHNVFPTMHGIAPKPMPRWVYDSLFAESTPAPTSAIEFLALHPGSAIKAFDERERGLPSKHLKAQELSPETILKAQEAFYGVFFSPNRVSSGRHLDEDVVEFRYFFLDFDGGNKPDQMRRIAELPFKPTFLIESGNGYHAYYRLNDSTIEPDVWRGIEKRLIERAGADIRACNPARVLRVPFTWHTKGQPQLVTIKSWSDHRYDWEQFADVFPAPVTQVFQLSAPSSKPSLKAAPAGVLTKDNRHAGLMDWLKKAYFRVQDDRTLAGDVRQRAKEWYSVGHTPLKRHWEQEVDDLCDWFERKQWGSVVSR